MLRLASGLSADDLTESVLSLAQTSTRLYLISLRESHVSRLSLSGFLPLRLNTLEAQQRQARQSWSEAIRRNDGETGCINMTACLDNSSQI